MSSVEGQGQFFQRRTSRRSFLRGFAANAPAAVLLLALPASVLASLECAGDDLTDEQKKALKLFETADEVNFVHNIPVIGEEVNGQKIAFLRDKPKTESDKGDFSAGDEKEKLHAGDIVDRALVVLGNNRQIPWDKKLQVKWLGIKTGNKVLFAYGGLFAQTPELDLSQPIDLSKI